MDKQTFEKFREIIYRKSGISLAAGKEALVAARVGRRMRALGLQDHRTYLDQVMRDETGEEMVHLLDAISTNVTSFFRERDHFDFLSSVMSKWIEDGQRQFRFWSAACSTGEEPYSLAITLLETAQPRGIDIKILATDISTRAIEKAIEGIYESDRVEGIPPALRERYLSRYHDSKGTSYAVNEMVRNLITFKRLNLSMPPFPMRGPFDAIFCRNVMIYFDNRVRKGLLSDMYRLLRRGGYLLVGHAESLTGMVSDFRVVRPSVYTR